MAIVKHPQLGLVLGLVQDVAEQREAGGHLGALGQREAVRQLQFVDLPIRGYDIPRRAESQDLGLEGAEVLN